jgi:hypothetical protein
MVAFGAIALAKKAAVLLQVPALSVVVRVVVAVAAEKERHASPPLRLAREPDQLHEWRQRLAARARQRRGQAFDRRTAVTIGLAQVEFADSLTARAVQNDSHGCRPVIAPPIVGEKNISAPRPTREFQMSTTLPANAISRRRAGASCS